MGVFSFHSLPSLLSKGSLGSTHFYFDEMEGVALNERYGLFLTVSNALLVMCSNLGQRLVIRSVESSFVD